MRSIAQWQAGDYTLSLGNGIIYAGDNPIGPGAGGLSEHYTSLQLAGELRRPLGFKIGGFAPDLGIYAAEYYYPSPLKFDRLFQSPLQVHNQNEFGFSIGSAEPFKLLALSNPRIGAGVIFGGGLTVYHVTLRISVLESWAGQSSPHAVQPPPSIVSTVPVRITRR